MNLFFLFQEKIFQRIYCEIFKKSQRVELFNDFSLLGWLRNDVTFTFQAFGQTRQNISCLRVLRSANSSKVRRSREKHSFCIIICSASTISQLALLKRHVEWEIGATQSDLLHKPRQWICGKLLKTNFLSLLVCSFIRSMVVIWMEGKNFLFFRSHQLKNIAERKLHNSANVMYFWIHVFVERCKKSKRNRGS